jgi:hypothetical protein
MTSRLPFNRPGTVASASQSVDVAKICPAGISDARAFLEVNMRLPHVRPSFCRSHRGLLREMRSRRESRKSVEAGRAGPNRHAQCNRSGSQSRYTREAGRSLAQMESGGPAEMAGRRYISTRDFAASWQIHGESNSAEARRISSLRNVN